METDLFGSSFFWSIDKKSLIKGPIISINSHAEHPKKTQLFRYFKIPKSFQNGKVLRQKIFFLKALFKNYVTFIQWTSLRVLDFVTIFGCSFSEPQNTVKKSILSLYSIYGQNLFLLLFMCFKYETPRKKIFPLNEPKNIINLKIMTRTCTVLINSKDKVRNKNQ